MTKMMAPAAFARGIMAVRADAGAGNVGAVLSELQRGFEAFKAAQAEKDSEVQARFDDVVTTEKMAKIDASVGELQAIVDEVNAKLAAMALGGDDGPSRDPEYTTAFRAHFRRGDVQAALNKGADDEGGYLAPIEWDRTITDKLVEVSQMRQIATVQNISTAGFKKLYNLRGTASGWVGETAARPQTATGEFGQMTITPGELYANPAATQQMLDDAAVNLEEWLANEVETEFALQEGLAFIAGDGANKPRGFLTFATGGAAAAVNPLGPIPVKTAAAPAAVTEDELIDVIYSLPGMYTAEARFTMNRTTMGAIRKLRDADGRQLWQPSTAAGQPSTLLNYPVTELPGMPDLAAGALPIAFGDFRRGYLIVDRTGVRVLRDPYTNKPYVMFYTTKRVGGAVNDPQALRVLRMAAA
ncbi:phage major capsid protein [Pseudoroseicyclus sp. H15]